LIEREREKGSKDRYTSGDLGTDFG